MWGKQEKRVNFGRLKAKEWSGPGHSYLPVGFFPHFVCGHLAVKCIYAWTDSVSFIAVVSINEAPFFRGGRQKSKGDSCKQVTGFFWFLILFLWVVVFLECDFFFFTLTFIMYFLSVYQEVLQWNLGEEIWLLGGWRHADAPLVRNCFYFCHWWPCGCHYCYSNCELLWKVRVLEKLHFLK